MEIYQSQIPLTDNHLLLLKESQLLIILCHLLKIILYVTIASSYDYESADSVVKMLCKGLETCRSNSSISCLIEG